MSGNVSTDQADSESGVRRRRASATRFWARAVSGGVVVAAALAVPEFSVGAGDLTDASRGLEPLEPTPARGLSPARHVSGAGEGALAGVRYGSLLKVSDTIRPMPAAPLIASSGVVLRDKPAPSAADPLPLVMAADIPEQAPEPEVGAFAPAASPSLLPGAGRETLTVVADTVRQDTVPFALADVEMPPSATMVPAVVPAQGAVSAQERAAAAPVPESALGTATGSFSALLPESDRGALATPGASTGAPAGTPGRSPVPALVAVAPVVSATPTDVAPVPPVSRPPLPASPVSKPKVASAPVASLASVPVRQRAAARAEARAVPAPSAAVSRPAPEPVAAIAAIPRPATARPATSLGAGISAYQFDVKSQLITRVDGKAAGAVDFQQTAAGLKVRLGSIIDVLDDRFEPGQLARLRASSASNTWLSLAELQANGIPISYDPVYDEFNVGQTDTRPKAARKVHIDQITTPERGISSTGMGQIRR